MPKNKGKVSCYPPFPCCQVRKGGRDEKKKKKRQFPSRRQNHPSPCLVARPANNPAPSMLLFDIHTTHIDDDDDVVVDDATGDEERRWPIMKTNNQNREERTADVERTSLTTRSVSSPSRRMAKVSSPLIPNPERKKKPSDAFPPPLHTIVSSYHQTQAHS